MPPGALPWGGNFTTSLSMILSNYVHYSEIIHNTAAPVTNLNFFVTRIWADPRQGKNSTSLMKIKELK